MQKPYVLVFAIAIFGLGTSAQSDLSREALVEEINAIQPGWTATIYEKFRDDTVKNMCGSFKTSSGIRNV
jgi:hypothetical protein